MGPSRQTISFLQRRLQAIGIRPDARRGQNFLIDLNLLELLANAAEIQRTDLVLEVGTGTGSLTAQLAARAGRVITVEVDARLQQLASEELASFNNIEFLQQDVLRNKNNLHGNVLDAIDRALGDPALQDFKLVANLPYSIATPLISNLLRTPHVPSRMAVTIQKELADRIVAEPNSKDYGALSVWVQSLGDPEILRVLPPSAFWPRPKVHSAFLKIDMNAEKRSLYPELEAYHQFVRAVFFHRRKFLRSVLLAAYKDVLDKPVIDRVMDARALGPDSRTEQLTIAELRGLFETLQEELRAR
jgi:16S rRNA (adenine1518-N6/adenine1519-N6)-dimethyltransferase